MITSVALMQLVEQGRVDLDDSDLLEPVLPKMKEVKVLEHEQQLDGQRILREREKKTRITLRMLETHTGEGRSMIYLSVYGCLVNIPKLDLDTPSSAKISGRKWERILI